MTVATLHATTLMVLGLYMLPTIVAIVRHSTRIGSIAVVNVFLGWTFFGWVGALAMAAGPVAPQVKR